jgi:hypothetical protein
LQPGQDLRQGRIHRDGVGPFDDVHEGPVEVEKQGIAVALARRGGVGQGSLTHAPMPPSVSWVL